MIRAVVFDLWETLVPWPPESHDRVVAELGAGEARERWLGSFRERGTTALDPYLATLGLDAAGVERIRALRTGLTRAALAPGADVVETLAELRRRGPRLGLLSNCSGEVPELWPETPFADLFDACVFSCSVGLLKPERAIYLAACERLGVEPAEALFVGDGANDELAGAERAGLRAVAVGPHDAEWSGARIASIPEILTLV